MLEYRYFNTLGSVLAFKITPYTRDKESWPKWLKDKISQDKLTNDVIYFENEYIHINSTLLGDKIVKNGYYIILDQRGRLSLEVDYNFEMDYVRS